VNFTFGLQANFRPLIGIFSQTAGPASEFWANPVNFRFTVRSSPRACFYRGRGAPPCRHARLPKRDTVRVCLMDTSYAPITQSNTIHPKTPSGAMSSRIRSTRSTRRSSTASRAGAASRGRRSDLHAPSPPAYLTTDSPYKTSPPPPPPLSPNERGGRENDCAARGEARPYGLEPHGALHARRGLPRPGGRVRSHCRFRSRATE
jgi:hypothetical protein